jgi:hypothetical protein
MTQATPLSAVTGSPLNRAATMVPMHVVKASHLRDYAPSWVLCGCGERFGREGAEAVRIAFEDHRHAMGEPPVSLSRALGSRRRLP